MHNEYRDEVMPQCYSNVSAITQYLAASEYTTGYRAIAYYCLLKSQVIIKPWKYKNSYL